MTDTTRLRADARHNREQIIVAARAVFLEQGIGAPLEEIARRADVGIATLYRRFPDRYALVRQVSADNIAKIGEELDRAEAQSDAFSALTHFLRRLVEFRVGAFMPMLAPTLEGDLRSERGELRADRDRIAERMQQIIHTAQQQGQLRQGIGPLDLLAGIIKLSRPLPVLSTEMNELLANRQLELFLGSLHATELDATEPLRPQPVSLNELDRDLKMSW